MISPDDKKKISLSGVSEVLESIDDLNVYVLYYRTNIVGNSFKVFKHAGDEHSAYLRATEHCKKMGYRFMSIVPFFADLAGDEETHAGTATSFVKTTQLEPLVK